MIISSKSCPPGPSSPPSRRADDRELFQPCTIPSPRSVLIPGLNRPQNFKFVLRVGATARRCFSLVRAAGTCQSEVFPRVQEEIRRSQVTVDAFQRLKPRRPRRNVPRRAQAALIASQTLPSRAPGQKWEGSGPRSAEEAEPHSGPPILLSMTRGLLPPLETRVEPRSRHETCQRLNNCALHVKKAPSLCRRTLQAPARENDKKEEQKATVQLAASASKACRK